MKRVNWKSLIVGFVACMQPALAQLNDDLSMRWHTKNLSLATVAEDANAYFYIVGLPKFCMCQFMGSTPAFNQDGHDFFLMNGMRPVWFTEVEYTADGEQIQRFRFVRKRGSKLSGDGLGGWQTQDFRKDPDDFTMGVDIVKLEASKDSFLMPFSSMPFTRKVWRRDRLHRSWLLFNLAHDYPLIGMKRKDLLAVLGKADDTKTAPKPNKFNADTLDRYVLSSGCMGIYSYLDMAYHENQLIGYRIAPGLY